MVPPIQKDGRNHFLVPIVAQPYHIDISFSTLYAKKQPIKSVAFLQLY